MLGKMASVPVGAARTTGQLPAGSSALSAAAESIGDVSPRTTLAYARRGGSGGSAGSADALPPLARARCLVKTARSFSNLSPSVP